MVFRSFKINCTIRVLLLAANLYLFFYVMFHTSLYSTMVILGILPVVQIVSMIRYVSRTNDYLTRTFDAIAFNDFSERLAPRTRDCKYKEVTDALNRIMDKFQKNRMETEQQFRYTRAIVQQTGMGLISLKPDGTVDLANKAARKILGMTSFTHIRELEAVNRELADALMKLPVGERAFFDFDQADTPIHLAVYARDIRMHGRSFKLLALQNIRDELDEKEMQAWKNLIRVLSHEIMNSMTPIASLAETARSLVGENGDIDVSDMGDVRRAVKTIEKRSRGLMQFVDNYRQFARIPKPNVKTVSMESLFERIEHLVRADIGEHGIRFETEIIPGTLHIRVDPELMEQVLLNLLNNAVYAVRETPDPRIRLYAEVDERSHTLIRVADNGPGMDQEVLSRIFIPFFTTRPNGSGIGLSLSRQIVQLHGGTIRVTSVPNVRTVFTLKL